MSSADFVVVGDLERTVDINRYVFHVYLADIAGMKIPVYIDQRYGVNIGEFIHSDEVYLTQDSAGKKGKNDIRVALRIGRFSKIDKNKFKPMKHIELRMYGKLIKTDRCRLKEVGADRRLFLASSFKLQDELKRDFVMLLVSFYKQAKVIDSIKSNTYVKLTAQLREKRDSGYELNATSVLKVYEKEEKM